MNIRSLSTTSLLEAQPAFAAPEERVEGVAHAINVVTEQTLAVRALSGASLRGRVSTITWLYEGVVERWRALLRYAGLMEPLKFVSLEEAQAPITRFEEVESVEMRLRLEWEEVRYAALDRRQAFVEKVNARIAQIEAVQSPKLAKTKAARLQDLRNLRNAEFLSREANQWLRVRFNERGPEFKYNVFEDIVTYRIEALKSVDTSIATLNIARDIALRDANQLLIEVQVARAEKMAAHQERHWHEAGIPGGIRYLKSLNTLRILDGRNVRNKMETVIEALDLMFEDAIDRAAAPATLDDPIPLLSAIRKAYYTLQDIKHLQIPADLYHQLSQGVDKFIQNKIDKKIGAMSEEAAERLHSLRERIEQKLEGFHLDHRATLNARITEAAAQLAAQAEALKAELAGVGGTVADLSKTMLVYQEQMALAYEHVQAAAALTDVHSDGFVQLADEIDALELTLKLAEIEQEYLAVAGSNKKTVRDATATRFSEMIVGPRPKRYSEAIWEVIKAKLDEKSRALRVGKVKVSRKQRQEANRQYDMLSKRLNLANAILAQQALQTKYEAAAQHVTAGDAGAIRSEHVSVEQQYNDLQFMKARWKRAALRSQKNIALVATLQRFIEDWDPSGDARFDDRDGYIEAVAVRFQQLGLGRAGAEAAADEAVAELKVALGIQ